VGDGGGGESVTRSAWLELKDEERLMKEGYAFLDEKRMILAAEMLKRLRLHDEREAHRSEGMAAAARALTRAIERHGVDDTAAAAPGQIEGFESQTDRSNLLGVRIEDARARIETGPPQRPRVEPTTELEDLAEAFSALVPELFELAVAEGTLLRLTDEYASTERRARALENVLLPELRDRLHFMGEQLEAMDQEDVVRVRFRKRDR
jgi:V/A-type H+/Na+-transporting ATPase subunit D